MTKIQPRPINEIAAEIQATWKHVNFGAKPYLQAMFTMTAVTDNYGEDDGRGVVLYFLSNATSFRGEDARRLKAELKASLQS